MVLLEAAAVVAVVGLVVYWLIVALSAASSRPDGRPRAARGGAWTVAHYERRGVTRVVVQRLARGTDDVLDEHVVAEIPAEAPDYDERFLAAMSAARERRALFESEDEG
jgi:hypothetical protein